MVLRGSPFRGEQSRETQSVTIAVGRSVKQREMRFHRRNGTTPSHGSLSIASHRIASHCAAIYLSIYSVIFYSIIFFALSRFALSRPLCFAWLCDLRSVCLYAYGAYAFAHHGYAYAYAYGAYVYAYRYMATGICHSIATYRAAHQKQQQQHNKQENTYPPLLERGV